MNVPSVSIGGVRKDDSRLANTIADTPKLSMALSTPDPMPYMSMQPTSGQLFKNFNRGSCKTNTTGRSRRTKKSLRLSDVMAAMYPGIKIGHKHCVQKPMLVPKTMGWLWNTEDTATGVPFPRGYRPGAIALGVKKGKMLRPRSVSEPSNTPIGAKGRKVRKKMKTISSAFVKSGSLNMEQPKIEDRPPTLYVRKEGGVYRVVMQPIRDPGAEEDTEEEQPVQFKIAESSAKSSTRQSGSSSSSLRIEYVCTGALRKPVVKPAFTEMGVQYDTADFSKRETERQVKIKEPDGKKTDKKEKKGNKKVENKEDDNKEDKKEKKEKDKSVGKSSKK